MESDIELLDISDWFGRIKIIGSFKNSNETKPSPTQKNEESCEDKIKTYWYYKPSAISKFTR